MVDFTLTEEQQNMREMAHDFAEKEIRPVAWEYDKDATWPQEIIEKAWELGLMNSHLPERVRRRRRLLSRRLPDRGGARLGLRRDRDDARRQRAGLGAGLARRLGGDQEASTSGSFAEEPKLASFCLTEPDAGSDVSGMRTTAVKKGDKYVINGSKCFITNGGYADWYTVYAKTDKDAGHRGISAFVVPRDETVTVDKHEDKMGLRASNTATISFNETEVPAAQPARRGEPRLQARDDDPRPHASRRRVDGHRHRPRRLRVRHRVLQGARAVRRADRDAPGDPVHDRRHGDQDRGGPPARLEVGRAARPGPAQHARLLARQALRRRLGDGGRRSTPSRSTAATAS